MNRSRCRAVTLRNCRTPFSVSLMSIWLISIERFCSSSRSFLMTVAGAFVVAADVAENFLEIRELRIRGIQQLFAHARVHVDRGQRLIDLVRDGRAEFTDHRQSRGVRQLEALTLCLQQRLRAVRDAA